MWQSIKNWTLNKWQRFKRFIIAGIAIPVALAAASTPIADEQINPYSETAQVYEITKLSAIPEAGKNKIELSKTESKVTLKKWDDEVALGIRYGKIKAQGSRAFLTNRVEWKGAKEELHAYPLPAREGMEDGGFEIEVVLNEKPDTNVFEFAIDGAENLDFFYQPALTLKEIAEGASQPDNVIGSYAVYHKTKANHRTGSTNYATGKAFHIYRPKAIDVNGTEAWAELAYVNGVLTVTVPQKFLDEAMYPVKIDPTFGYTTIGGTNSFFGSPATARFTSPENGDITSITTHTRTNGAAEGELGNAIYSDSSASPTNKLAEDSGNFSPIPGVTDPQWVSTNISYTMTGGVDYHLAIWGSVNRYIYHDVGGAAQENHQTGQTFETWPDPFNETGSNAWNVSIYATYTASGGGGVAPTDAGIIFIDSD